MGILAGFLAGFSLYRRIFWKADRTFWLNFKVFRFSFLAKLQGFWVLVFDYAPRFLGSCFWLKRPNKTKNIDKVNAGDVLMAIESV
jgi:hypothetical protein